MRAAGAASLVLAAGAASAQTPPAASAAPAANVPTYGPPLSGICVFSKDLALTTSAAGVSVNQQLQQLSQSAQATLDVERNAITAADKALTAEKPKLSAAKYQTEQSALQQRAQTYTATVQARQAQFSQARDKALDQIAATVTPILVATITERHCSIIVERGGIYGANPAMDLTPDVIQKLNAVLPTVAVSLPPEAAQGQH